MLNTTSNTAAQSFKFNDIFVESSKSAGIATTGRIFRNDNFAKGWEEIYVKPSFLLEDTVEKEMRCITCPSLLISSKNARMAFVLASEDEPVYFPSEDTQLPDGAYLLSYRILPVITPEYIYYMCEYGIWENGIEDFSLPTLSEQNERVASAKRRDALFEQMKYDVADIVNWYKLLSKGTHIFSEAPIGLLVEAYRIAAGNLAKQEVIEILSQYEFEAGVLPQNRLRYLSQHLKELYELVLESNDVTFHPSEGFVQPQEVTEFMCKIADFPKNVIVYNPFAGANSYSIALPNHVVGEELNPISWALGQIRLFAEYADKKTEISLGDSLDSIKSDKKYSAIITSPAYILEDNHEIFDIVRMLYAKLEEGGKLACIVPASFLFSKISKARTLREQLIRDKAISAVVMLPSNIFTGIGIEQASLVITKGVNNNEIHFGDASGHTRFAKSVYRATTFDLESFLDAYEADIVDTQEGYEPGENQAGATVSYHELHGSDLTPSLYLTPKPENGIPLSFLVEEVHEQLGKETSSDYFITGSSIPSALHRKPFVPSKNSHPNNSSAYRYVKTPQSAVIIAIANGEIRSVYTDDFIENIAFLKGSIKIVKPVNGISAKYVAALLSTKIVSDQIKAQSVGTTIPSLKKLDLRHIIVPLHKTAEERDQLVADVLSAEMSDLEAELQKNLNSQKREVRSTRHAMIQTLASLSSKWERLKIHIERNKGTLHLTDMIGRANPTTIQHFMEGIEYAIDTLQRQVEAFRLEKKDWGESVEINPYEFIETYRTTHISTDFTIQNLSNNNKANIPGFIGEDDEDNANHTDAIFTFKAPRALVERIFDNIVSNAKAHGFTPEITNPTIQFDWLTKDGRIEITIKNNGVPLKKGVSGEDVLMSDFSTSLKQEANDGTIHFGIGGYEIKTLMEDFGTVEVISQPDADFPVIYKLTFNDVSLIETSTSDN